MVAVGELIKTMKNVRFTGSDWYEIVKKQPLIENVGSQVKFLGFSLIYMGNAICVLTTCDYCGKEYPTIPFCSKCGAHMTGMKFINVSTINEAIDTIWSK